jgi:hypothetical protein
MNSQDTDYAASSQVTPEELETILMLTRKMEGGDKDRVSSPEEGSTNKRKRGRPQRALSSSIPIAPAIPASSTTIHRTDMDRNKEGYYFDDRDSSSETDVHGNHSNIMSIQNMLNNSTNALMRQEPPPEEEFAEKSWRSEKKRSRELKGAYPNGEYNNNNNYGQQSWHETLDKAVKGRQEKEMLDELAAILELPTKNFPHNTARLLYAKLEALKLLRETCDRGLISEELYAEKQQEFLDSMQF